MISEITCKTSYTVYGRRHLKQLTISHVSWDILYSILINEIKNFNVNSDSEHVTSVCLQLKKVLLITYIRSFEQIFIVSSFTGIRILKHNFANPRLRFWIFILEFEAG